MKALTLVFLGGGLGAMLRYGLGMLFPLQVDRLPWATLLANLIAALTLGWIAQMNLKPQDPLRYLLLATGFCGGLSTFSTFSLETIQLFQRGDTWLAIANIALNLVFSLVLIWLLLQVTPNSK